MTTPAPASAPRSGRTCIFTIAAKNYLHYARTLHESIAKHAPDADRWLVLCDGGTAEDLKDERFKTLPLKDLALPDRDRFIFQYSLLELSTAIKPFAINHFFKSGYERVIYFDPDICVYRDLTRMLKELDRCDVLLTPHITQFLDDGKRPDEREILICGAYNLGFIGLRKSSNTERLATWWEQKLERDCVVDMKRGLFVDQKWVDLVPSLFESVCICRDPGWNVAYWNLLRRDVTLSGSDYSVSGVPLTFFHFSGLDYDKGVFSKYQDRFTLQNLPPAVKSLVEGYSAALRRHGYPDTTKEPYAFGTFHDGTPVPDIARRIYREHRDEIADRFPHILGSGSNAFLAYLNEPAVENGRSSPFVTRLGLEVLRSREDLGLPTQFPDPLGAHARAFAEWFVDAGKSFCNLPDAFIEPVRRALQRETSSTAETDGGSTALKTLYKLAWRFKNITHFFLPLATRQKIHAWLFRSAYAKDGAASAQAQPRRADGLNIVGYVRAELGVGEAARSTIRAATAAGIPFSVVDFRKGTESRMDEEFGAASHASPEFGINLLHLNAEQIPFAIAELDKSFFKNRYTIAFWNWELPELPEDWLDSLRFVDEIWAPTDFCHRAFSRRVLKPVTHIPYCIDLEVAPGMSRKDFGIPDDGAFVFLFMFDAFSIPQRKNPLAAVESYLKALPSFTRPTRLVLKVINGSGENETLNAIRRFTAANPSITLIEQYLKRPELNALFQTADCYVSLHRSEGYGLTLAESMYLGKPVIATGWSGNMDFMTPWNSFPVKYKLVEIDEDRGPYKKGQIWADPDTSHAAECMIRVVNEPELARRIGETARADIARDCAPAHVGAIIRKRLAAICDQ